MRVVWVVVFLAAACSRSSIGDPKQQPAESSTEFHQPLLTATDKYEALGREYTRLIESSSWRLTEPLRRLKARLKGRREPA